MSETFESIDAIRAGLGTTMGPSGWFAVNQGQIDAFAALTGDRQWIHVDPERAASGPFGQSIAHGYLTLSLIPQFGSQLFRLEVGSARINYGVNKVRFPTPVPAGTRVRARAKFLEVAAVPAGHQLTTQYFIELEGTAKPACVAEAVTLVLP